MGLPATRPFISKIPSSEALRLPHSCSNADPDCEHGFEAPAKAYYDREAEIPTSTSRTETPPIFAVCDVVVVGSMRNVGREFGDAKKGKRKDLVGGVFSPPIAPPHMGNGARALWRCLSSSWQLQPPEPHSPCEPCSRASRSCSNDAREGKHQTFRWDGLLAIHGASCPCQRASIYGIGCSPTEAVPLLFDTAEISLQFKRGLACPSPLPAWLNQLPRRRVCGRARWPLCHGAGSRPCPAWGPRLLSSDVAKQNSPFP